MTDQRKNFWSAENVAARKAKIAERDATVLTHDQLRAQLKAQRDARVNTVMRSGLRSRSRA